MRIQLHSLELVFPPISNQEAEWLLNSEEGKEEISKSNLYFIGQKPETHFAFKDDVLNKIEQEGIVYFDYITGNTKDSGYINLVNLLKFYKHPDNLVMDIELGEKMIRIRNMGNDNVIEWFTTDKILFDRSRGKPFIGDFNSYSDFFTYNLHYVGISTKQSSFNRLIIQPHDKRLRILSNEHPLNYGSRVTDEIVLFFFRVKSLEIKQYDLDDDFAEVGTHKLGDYSRIINDAEKAFVKIMNTEYNEVKFDNFPFSANDIYTPLVDKLSFSIDENITFITDTNTIAGKRKNPPFEMEGGDFIAISEDAVELIKVE